MPDTDVELSALARTFHALSDETRLRIIELLVGGERCVCELTDSLDAAQSRLSFHLKVLKDAGLVTDRRDGRWVYYTLATPVMEETAAFLGGVKPVERSWPLRSVAKNNGASCC
jgi:ArsR family transcriptional regulator